MYCKSHSPPVGIQVGRKLADLVHEAAGSGLSSTQEGGQGRELFTAKAMELIAHITPGAAFLSFLVLPHLQGLWNALQSSRS